MFPADPWFPAFFGQYVLGRSVQISECIKFLVFDGGALTLKVKYKRKHVGGLIFVGIYSI